MRCHLCQHVFDDFLYHSKPLLYTDIVKDRGFLCQQHTQLYSDSQTIANNLSDGLYGTTQDITLDQLMKHMSDWNHPFVFDIGYTLPIAPDKNNTIGIGERGMLHAFSYSGKHFYCIDSSKGWQESPYALKSNYLTKNDTVIASQSFAVGLTTLK